jgi:hypothetical protein
MAGTAASCGVRTNPDSVVDRPFTLGVTWCGTSVTTIFGKFKVSKPATVYWTDRVGYPITILFWQSATSARTHTSNAGGSGTYSLPAGSYTKLVINTPADPWTIRVKYK